MSQPLGRKTISFILRLWAESAQGDCPPQWRGQIEHVGTGERTHFQLPAALVDFFSAHLPVIAHGAGAAVQPDTQEPDPRTDG